MDTTRSTGDQGRPRTPGSRAVDPVTGTPAVPPGGADRSPDDTKTPKELKQDIRRTRAEMSQTVDAIERRLSPERLKQEAKNTVHETIDEVKERLNPQRYLEDIGNSMLETAREHPLPTIIAGLSLGYLLMKSAEGSSRYDYDDDDDYDRDRYRVRSYPRRGYGNRYGYREDYRSPDYGEYNRNLDYDSNYRRDVDYVSADDDDGRSLADRASNALDSVKETAGELREQAGDAVSQFTGQVQHQGRSVRGQVRRRGRRARGGLETFIDDNPLAAGAIALGIGALIGGVLPTTRYEDEWMGEASDRVLGHASEAAQETLNKAQQVAGRVAEEAKEAAKEVGDKAREEARHVQAEAQAGAEEVKEKAQHEVNEKAEQARQDLKAQVQETTEGDESAWS